MDQQKRNQCAFTRHNIYGYMGKNGCQLTSHSCRCIRDLARDSDKILPSSWNDAATACPTCPRATGMTRCGTPIFFGAPTARRIPGSPSTWTLDSLPTSVGMVVDTRDRIQSWKSSQQFLSARAPRLARSSIGQSVGRSSENSTSLIASPRIGVRTAYALKRTLKGA